MNKLTPFGSMEIGTITFSCGKEILITNQNSHCAVGFEVLERSKESIKYGGNPLYLPGDHMGYIRSVSPQ